MGHTLTLEIPEDVFEPIEKIAKQTGRTPEEIILQTVASHARQVADHPLDKWVGAFDSGIPD